MYDPAPGACQVPEIPDPLARADALEREITDLYAQINAAGYRLLQLVAELDDEAPWGAWGLSSCAHCEKVRVAHALRQLPRTSACFATGELSFSKVRAVTRIAYPENEKELLDLARHATAAQVEKLVRAYRRVGRLEAREQAKAQHASRELHYYHDEDGCLVIRARLPATGNVKGLAQRNPETGEAIDASSWIVAGDTLDYSIAIEGLMRRREREPPGIE
jgi:hypothetical protein